jgi:acyl-CoA synthetase (AMP-forming)/AMP-acid ligase II
MIMKSSCPEKNTVPECIEYYREQDPGALCCSVRAGGEWLSYSREQFWDYVCRYASLFARNLSEPTLVLFIKKLDIHLLAAYIGAMKAGHLPAQISPPTAKVSESEYRRRIDHIQKITGFGALFIDLKEQARYAEITQAKVFSSQMLGELSGASRGFPSEDALVQFSSGSTGLQKGVVLTHRGIIAHMQSYAAALRTGPSDAVVSWLPLYHDMGLIACYLMPLMCGAPFYQMDPFDWITQPDVLLAVIEEKKPTLCFLPNFAYHLLVNKGKAHDLGSIRMWINCSEPARLSSHELFTEKYRSVRPETMTVCYALAENTFAVTQTLPWHGNSRRLDAAGALLSCGKPLPGVEVAVFDSENTGAGEIGVHSPSLFNNFLDGTRPLRDGFYLTGDLGFMDEHGELFITGRKKDLIIVCGKNIFPQDVEFAASAVGGIYPGRVVAFGIWNEEMGTQDLFVLAERQDGNAPTPLKIAIQKAVMDEVGIVPKRVEILEHMSLVKTSSGKISRVRNKAIFESKGFSVL